jgi:hypothetical protein
MIDAAERWLSLHIRDSRLRGNERDGEAVPMIKRPLATLLVIPPLRCASAGGAIWWRLAGQSVERHTVGALKESMTNHADAYGHAILVVPTR